MSPDKTEVRRLKTRSLVSRVPILTVPVPVCHPHLVNLLLTSTRLVTNLNSSPTYKLQSALAHFNLPLKWWSTRGSWEHFATVVSSHRRIHRLWHAASSTARASWNRTFQASLLGGVELLDPNEDIVGIDDIDIFELRDDGRYLDLWLEVKRLWRASEDTSTMASRVVAIGDIDTVKVVSIVDSLHDKIWRLCSENSALAIPAMFLMILDFQCSGGVIHLNRSSYLTRHLFSCLTLSVFGLVKGLHLSCTWGIAFTPERPFASFWASFPKGLAKGRAKGLAKGHCERAYSPVTLRTRWHCFPSHSILGEAVS